jgi:hypothetical protein
MALEFGLLGEGLVRAMASFPAAVVPITLGPIDGTHMTSNEMLLESTRVRKCSAANSFDSMNARRPFADMQLIVL